jgi:hypothetical protein
MISGEREKGGRKKHTETKSKGAKRVRREGRIEERERERGRNRGEERRERER